MPAIFYKFPKFPGAPGSEASDPYPTSRRHPSPCPAPRPQFPTTPGTHALNDPPILHMQHPVAHLGQLLVVGHDQEGLLELLTKLEE